MKSGQEGPTFLELMIVVAYVACMSAIFYVAIHFIVKFW